MIRGPLPFLIFFLAVLGFSLSTLLSPVMQDLFVSHPATLPPLGRRRKLISLLLVFPQVLMVQT